jgi:hypothetical protein
MKRANQRLLSVFLTPSVLRSPKPSIRTVLRKALVLAPREFIIFDNDL